MPQNQKTESTAWAADALGGAVNTEDYTLPLVGQDYQIHWGPKGMAWTAEIDGFVYGQWYQIEPERLTDSKRDVYRDTAEISISRTVERLQDAAAAKD